MAKKANLTNERFGRLLVIGETIERDFGFVVWACRCDCGALVSRSTNILRAGKSQSCGCLRSDLVAAENTTHGGAKGKRKERLYCIWKQMRARCANPNLPFAHRYVNRGIQVCPEWQDYAAFRDWALSHGYSSDLSIDRIDFDGHYEPSNCRWISRAEQSRNTSVSNPLVEFAGQRRRKQDVLAEVGLKASVYDRRVRRGWNPDRAATTPCKTQLR